MANLNNPTGLNPCRHLVAGPYSGAGNWYAFASGDGAACFPGDPVKLTGTANADGIPVIARAAAGEANIGPLCFLEVSPDSLTVLHRIANRVCLGFVADSPDLICEIQEDSVGGAIAVASVGLSTDLVLGSGSSVTGLSNAMLDSSDVGTDTGGQYRIMRLVQRPGNVVGNYAKWEVLNTEHQYKSALDI